MRQDLRARLRSEKSFARKPGKLKPRALILIVCEDSISAPAYFRAVRAKLRLSTAEVEVYGKECGSAPINVAEFALERKKIRKKEGSPPDHVFPVVDVDHHGTLDQARDFARANGLDLIVSCPCFERWYLLHFERGDRPFDSFDEIKRPLKKHLPAYDKGTFAEFDFLWARIRTAFENAERLRRSRAEDPAQTAYTDVDLLLRKLLEAAGSPSLPALSDESKRAPRRGK